ncbi:neprilysin-2-like [Belonocnema kinseyi]|uniref:neprilysin-2-like n=1 Tax=Belonocnema kinseyi TaxID=2817044 RepID=UPI00143CE899|nr:neprilysin-2-like [Belonocnema kinseyi]
MHDPTIIEYYKYMVEIAVIFGADEARAKNELKDSLEFEINLAAICVSKEDKYNATNIGSAMKLRELAKQYPSIPWKEYFNLILKPIFVIRDDELIQVRVPSFFQNFEKLLKKTSRKALANFMFWKAVENDMDYFPEKVINRRIKFNPALSHYYIKGDRLQTCLGTSEMLLLFPGTLYARKYIKPETNKNAEILAENIKQQYKEIITKVDWMDEKTKTIALAKLASMKMSIGYPKEIQNDKLLNKFYGPVELDPNDYLRSVDNMAIFLKRRSWMGLRLLVDDSVYNHHVDTATLNDAPRYFRIGNKIDVHPGMLQGIFYDDDRPQYLNYAAIGSFHLGHEMTRAVDNYGRHYDQFGAHRDWWTAESIAKFVKKVDCIIRQYSNYTVNEASVKVDGYATGDSNIADSAGLKAAYQAYQNLVKQKGPEPTLPGLNYSQSQLFWIQAAITKCAKYTPDYLKNLVHTNHDIPSEFRVIGSFSNAPEFASDFHCPCEILDAANNKEREKEKDQTTNKVCQTSACEKAASTIRESIDTNIKPCDDFYKFACGNFLKTAAIPNNNEPVDRYSSLAKEVREQTKKVIEKPVQPEEPKWMKLTKNFYKACMDTKAIDKNNLSTELRHLKEAGGWPVLENKWVEKNFDWKRTNYRMQKLGYNIYYLFDFDVVDIGPPYEKKHGLYIDQPILTLGREVLIKGIKDPTVTEYYKYMVDVAVIFGANEDRAKNELKDALDFEINLATICVSEEDKNSKTNYGSVMKVRELAKQYPSIPWKEYFNLILKSIFVIGDDEVIQVRVPPFFQNLEKLLKKTSKRALANFMFWKAVENDMDYLTEKVINRRMRFNPTLSDYYIKGDRLKTCFRTSNMLVLFTDTLYARKYIKPETKKNAEILAENIKQQYQQIIKKVDWMDEKTKTTALAKLASMKMFIGYPKEIQNDKLLDQFYGPVEMNPDDYLQTVDNMAIYLKRRSWKKLRKYDDASNWTFHVDSTTVNDGPEYFPMENSIDFPPGMLQGIFYDDDRPQYLNYAAIGPFHLGHEITRAVDNYGRHYDNFGADKEWWTAESDAKFVKKVDCIIQQYSNYTVKEASVKVDGYATGDFNIADSAGAKAAYEAYQNLVKEKGPEPTLPGLKYSQSQLFWIQAAITKCSKYTPDYLRDLVHTRHDIPSEFRVIGTFSNSPEFASDFHCPVGSQMNPVKKCSVF